MLCIDKQQISILQFVQKDVDLGYLIDNHTKYFDDLEDAFDRGYVPLDFCVSVRSMYSNKVLEIAKEDKMLYYTNITDIQQFPHKGYDLVMYLTSIGLMQNIDYKVGFDNLMLQHSHFSPIGLYNPNPLIINPIIYSHVILSDEGIEELSKYLKEGRQIVNINDIKEKGNIKNLLDTLVIVKEREKNE